MQKKSHRTGQISRRRVLGLAASAAAASLTHPGWIFALNPRGQIVKAALRGRDATWTPKVLEVEQAEALGILVETLIPRTTTPGALDARVHEYIDLALFVAERERRDEFLDGLEWLRARCRRLYGKPLAELGAAQCRELLASISDEHETHPEELEPGAQFFLDLKRRTVFGYYTSRQGRVEELGLPEAVGMETFRGCVHPQDHA